jgi:hypothetical protein
MTIKVQDDWDDLELDAPIIPEDKKEDSYAHSGWKFYLKVRIHLNDYWQEFNSSLDKKQNPKYKTVRRFAESKFKKTEERDLFYLMTCSYQEYEACARETHKANSRMIVPWVGDWVKRRKNGYWQESNSVYIKSLRKTIKDNQNSTEAIKATGPFLIQEMMRYSRLQGKIEQAFGGEPFLDEAPTTSANKKRFDVFIEMLAKVTGMKMKLLHEWMRIHGVNPHRPNEMWNMSALAQSFGQVGAAGALTGAAAVQQGIMLSNPNGQPTLLSRDALLMADHLTDMTKAFQDTTVKEKVIDAKPKEKTNGKHVTQ